MKRSWQLPHDGRSCCTQGHGAKTQYEPLIYSDDTPSSTLSYISVFLGLPKLLGVPGASQGWVSQHTGDGVIDSLSA